MRKLAFLYLFAALAASLPGCSVEPFDMPSWDVELNLPVVTEDYTLLDLADDEDAVKVLGDSLYIEVSEAMSSMDLAGRFTLNPYSGDFAAHIGHFEVDAIEPGSTSFTIAEVWEDAAGFSGHVEVPPFCFPGPGDPRPSRALDLGGGFAWAEVEEGVLGVTVENRLAVPLGDPAGGCPFVLRVCWGGGVWDSVVFDEPIPAGESAAVDVDISGKTIENSILVSMEGGSPGSGGPVDFSHLDEIRIGAAPRDIIVSRALATLPQQSFSAEHSVTVEDSTRVVLAGIESGLLNLTIANHLPVDLWIEIGTGELTLEGEPFYYSAGVPAFSWVDAGIDISGYTLDTGCVPGNPWYGTNTLTFDVVAETPGTSAQVEVASTDSVQVEVELRDIVFDRVTGTLKPTDAHISEVHDLHLPELCRVASMSEATLVLSIRNEAMVGGRFEVEVTGEAEGDTETAVLTGEIVPAELSGAPSEAEYEYTGREIRDLISILPERITIEGDATVWGEGRVYSTDALRGEITISVPMVFEVEADTVELDPRDFEIPDDVRDEIEGAAREVTFCGRLVTDLDLSGSFNVYFGADSAGVYDAPLLSMAGPGGLAPFGGGGAGAEFEVHLDRDDLEVFLRERLWVGLEVMLDASEEPVTARPSNYLRLEGRLRLVRRVD